MEGFKVLNNLAKQNVMLVNLYRPVSCICLHTQGGCMKLVYMEFTRSAKISHIMIMTNDFSQTFDRTITESNKIFLVPEYFVQYYSARNTHTG